MAGETILGPVPTRAATVPAGLIATPFQFILTGAENLRIRSANSLAGVVIAVQGRLLQSDGTVAPFTLQHTPNTDRSIATQNYAIGPGTILTLVAFALSGSPTRGQTFVQVDIIQGLSGGTTLLGTLMQGYVTSFQNLAWPGTPLQSSLEGRGYLYMTTVANPPVATSASFTAPSNTRWRVQAVTMNLATDASAPLRFPFLELFIGGILSSAVATNNSLGASASGLFSWVSGCLFGTAHTGSLQVTTASIGPGFEMHTGDVATITWYGASAGDQLSAINYIVEEWLELN